MPTTTTHLRDALALADAWAAGAFTKISAREAWERHGFDAIDPEPLVHTTKDGTTGAWNPLEREIEWTDDEGLVWCLNPETGHVRRG